MHLRQRVSRRSTSKLEAYLARTNECVGRPCSDGRPLIPAKNVSSQEPRHRTSFTSHTPRRSGSDATELGTAVATHLTERVRELRIKVLDDRRDLTFQLELVSLLEVKAGGVNDGEQQPVVLALANLDACRLYALRALGRPPQKAIHRRLLVCGGGWGYIRSFQDEAKQGSLARALRTSNLPTKNETKDRHEHVEMHEQR